MKQYFYIMASENRDNIHAGTCFDADKMITFYNKLPHSLIDGSKLNRLVYMEEYLSTESALERLENVTKLSIQGKRDIIESVNPNYIELTTKDIN